ncbi:MAG: hypothetical protein MUO40_04735 [Anaerolineaceae bacterium]|nr:hypothetical protein [Anaerolineaceae bacterium]
MRFRSLLFLIILILLACIPTSAGVFAQEDLQSLLVADINYVSFEDLAFLSSKYDTWEVAAEKNTVKLMLTKSEFDQLSSMGYILSLDSTNTDLVNTPLESLPGQRAGIPGYACYRTVEETYAAAQSLASNYPTLVTLTKIGESWEKQNPGGLAGYDLMLLKLTSNDFTGDKPKILISSGVHARELAPVELNLRFAEHLLDQYDNDADITWLLNYHEIHLLMITNPDGRKQAETGLYWRKNTNETYCVSDSSRHGADLNRNFSFHWDSGYASIEECNELYRGPVSLSEPESSALSSYELSLFPDQRGLADNDPAPLDATGIYIDLHSYGEDVLWPYGFDTTSIAPNNTQLQTFGRKLAYFTDYGPKQSSPTYVASGATDDYAYGTFGVASFTIEMGTTFFQDCTSFENTIFPDNLEALLYAAKVARTPYMTPAGPDALDLVVPDGMLSFDQSFPITANINDARYQNVFEPTQNIAAAQYSVDQPPWESGVPLYSMSPQDGIYDSTIETVTALVNPSGLSGGRHILYVRGQDIEGNWGSVSAVFFTIKYGFFFPLSYR